MIAISAPSFGHFLYLVVPLVPVFALLHAYGVPYFEYDGGGESMMAAVY